MSQTPLMPKATAVWLVENTSLTFEQIADFCHLHPLEVKGIADGEVAAGIKGFDPTVNGQLSREETRPRPGRCGIPAQDGAAEGQASRDEERQARPALHARSPAATTGRMPSCGCCATIAELKDAQVMRLVRHHEDDDPADPRAHALELGEPGPDGSGDSRPRLPDRPRFRGAARRQGSGPRPSPKPRPTRCCCRPRSRRHPALPPSRSPACRQRVSRRRDARRQLGLRQVEAAQARSRRGIAAGARSAWLPAARRRGAQISVLIRSRSGHG